MSMSLDKWIKPEERKKKPKKEESVKSKDMSTKKSKSSTGKLIKHLLICSKPKCKYHKTIIKKELTEKDLICPKCKSKMRIKS
jgi:acetyl-CoA carboxylase beta subunit